jgi:biopolymer transport protein ExbB/TolQ
MTSHTTLSAMADFFEKGGPFMVLLVLLSILTLTAMLLRAWRLRESAIIPRQVAEAVDDLRPGHTLTNLQTQIELHPSSISHVLATLISHLNWSKSENLEAVQTCARHEIAAWKKVSSFWKLPLAPAPSSVSLAPCRAWSEFLRRWETMATRCWWRGAFPKR